MNFKEIFSWGMYDFSNTIFSALFVSFFYPFFIKQFLGGNEFHVGLVFGISLVLVGLVVPLLGHISDMKNKRIGFIFWFTLFCCVFTVLVIFGNLWLALLFGLLANFCYHAALTFYNALLPKISGQRQGFVSGVGVCLGYLGTLLGLGIAYLVLGKYGWESLEGMRAIFISIAILFFIFSLFLFLSIKETSATKGPKISFSKKIAHIADSVRAITRNSSLRSFLLGMFFYTNAINAVIIFLFLYARETIGLGVKEFFPVYTIFALAAAVGAFIFGHLTDKFGAKRILIFAGFVWLGIILLLLRIASYGTFLIAGILGGAAMGIVWTASRPKLISLAPKKNIAEYFGFLEMTDKFSGTFGPIIFGFLAAFFSYYAALISLVVFFILGLACFRFVEADKIEA